MIPVRQAEGERNANRRMASSRASRTVRHGMPRTLRPLRCAAATPVSGWKIRSSANWRCFLSCHFRQRAPPPPASRGDNSAKKSYPRRQNLPYPPRQLVRRGAPSRGILKMEQAGGTGRRCASDTSGANPKWFADAVPAAGRHAGLGRPRGSTWRSLRTSRQELGCQAARMPSGKRGPGPKKAAEERRERAAASWPRSPASGDRPTARRVRGAAIPHHRLSALCSLIF